MLLCLKPRSNSFSVMNGTTTDVLPPAAAISCSVGASGSFDRCAPSWTKSAALDYHFSQWNRKNKVRQGNQRLPRLNAAVWEGSVCQRWHPKQFACCVNTHPPRGSPGLFFDSYRRQNPWQPIACFGGENTEGTSKHHQGDKTRGDSRCRYCDISVMNGEFTRFSSPVVCPHWRNLGWI